MIDGRSAMGDNKRSRMGVEEVHTEGEEAGVGVAVERLCELEDRRFQDVRLLGCEKMILKEGVNSVEQRVYKNCGYGKKS